MQRKTQSLLSLAAAGVALALLLALGAVRLTPPLTTEAAAQQRVPPPSREAAQYSFAPIVRKAAPAVVNVYVRSRVQTFNSPSPTTPGSAASSATSSASRRSA